jgi:hypothetical protein
MSPPRAWVETVLSNPDSMQGELTPPPVGSDWRGGPWELAGVSMGPRLYWDDQHSPVWFVISWRRS